MNNLSNYYQRKKTVFIFLDTDKEIQDLAAELKNSNKAYFTTKGRDKIKAIWESKKYDYIVWTYRTNQEERWVVLVLDTKNQSATIHTTSQATPAQKELEEVTGFLASLGNLNNAKAPNLDIDIKNRTAEESSLVAILYVLKILKSIKTGTYTSKIDTSDFADQESDGKTKIEKVKEKYDLLVGEIAKIPSLDKLSTKEGSPPAFKTIESIKGDIKKLLKDTQTKWNDYLKKTDSDDINIRMFQSFKETAKEILPLIEKALASSKELSDYQLLDKEWAKNNSEYDNSRDYLNAWYTLLIFLHEWTELNKKTLQKELSSADKQKLADFDKLKKEREEAILAKKQAEAKILSREEQIKQIRQIVPQQNSLLKEIRQRIVQAYNSEEYLRGSQILIMKSFLDWEYYGNDEQKGVVDLVKSEINKCIQFLEKSQTQTNY